MLLRLNNLIITKECGLNTNKALWYRYKILSLPLHYNKLKFMDIIGIIQEGVVKGIEHLYGQTISADSITMNATRSEFEGDYTIVVFPYTKMARKKPEDIGNDLGQFMVDAIPRNQAIQCY